MIWAAERLKRTTRGRARSTARQTKLARSVLKDLGCWEVKTDKQRESKEHSQADQAGKVRFGGFGLLSGQNGPPEGEQGAQPSTQSWPGQNAPPEGERGPFWRIWAVERPKRSTRGRARRTAKQSKLARTVLEDLGRSADKTEHQGETGTETFDFFTDLSGHRGCTCVCSLSSWLCLWLSVRSCLDTPFFCQNLQIMSYMAGMSSSVGRGQGS